jgi:hypothetical protein
MVRVRSLGVSVAAAALLVGTVSGSGQASRASMAAVKSSSYELIPLDPSTVPAGAAISRHGRFVAFTAYANTPGVHPQVLVWDRQSATLTPVSVSPTGDPGDRSSKAADISLDGRYVLFTSSARNLVPGDTNDRRDSFVRDLRTGTTHLVSLSSTGDQLNRRGVANSLTADGRVVFFRTSARAMPRDRNGHDDVYARDRVTGAMSLVSSNSHGHPGNHGSTDAVSSDNGRWVAFASHATNLAPGDRSFAWDIFLKGLKTGHTRLVSVKPTRVTRFYVRRPSGISGDGQVIAFDASAEIDGNRAGLPFVFQRATGKVRNLLGYRHFGHVSGSGNVNTRHGALVTIGTDKRLTRNDNRRGADVYLLRLSTGRFTLLTHQNTPTSDRPSFWLHLLSPDGHVLLFQTDAQFSSADTDHELDAYLRDLP